MSVVLRNKPDFIPRAYAKLGLRPPADFRAGYLLMERPFDPLRQRRVEKFFWVAEREGATPFGSEADAWAAFDRSGCGRREDYETETL